MTTKPGNSSFFFIRLGAVLAATVLVMYLAKIWFIDPLMMTPSSPPKGIISEQKNEPLPLLQQPENVSSVIAWQDAADHYEEYATVKGKIVATHNSGKACFLNFHPDYKHNFTAVIFSEAFSSFPDNPENYYLEKQVLVTGTIQKYKGKPEIILEDASQIEIITD